MRLIQLAVVLFLVSGSAFADVLIQPGTPVKILRGNDMRLEEQNGKLLFPILDPKTGKYIDDVARATQIVEQGF